MKENDNPLGMHALQFRNARSVWNESFSKSQSARPVPPQCMQYGYNKTDSGPGRHGVHSIENNVRITNHEINASNYQMIPEYQPITVSISPQINNGNNNVKKEAMLMNNNGNNHGSETFIVSKDKHVQSRNENCNNGDIQMREQERGQDRNGDRNKNAFSSGSVKKEPVVINPFDDIVDIMSELIKQQTKQEFVMSDLNGRITTLTENVKISDVILDNVSFFKQNCGNMM